MYFTAIDMDTGADEIEHYGVQGMKWGVRKYVDYNGRLTAAGKQKYGTYQNAFKSSRAVRKDQAKRDYRSDISKLKANRAKSKAKDGSNPAINMVRAVGRARAYSGGKRVAKLNREITKIGGKRTNSRELGTTKNGKLVNTEITSIGYKGVARMAKDMQNGHSRGGAVARETGRRVAKSALRIAGTTVASAVARDVATGRAQQRWSMFKQYMNMRANTVDGTWREVPQALIGRKH